MPPNQPGPFWERQLEEARARAELLAREVIRLRSALTTATLGTEPREDLVKRLAEELEHRQFTYEHEDSKVFCYSCEVSVTRHNGGGVSAKHAPDCPVRRALSEAALVGE